MEVHPPESPAPNLASRLQSWANGRAPRLTAALTYYRLLRRQSKALAAAGRDPRTPEELLAAAANGVVTGITGHVLTDARIQVGGVTPVQVREELLGMLERVHDLRPARICEIGASTGGTLYLLTRVAAPDALVISVDIDLPTHTRRARARMTRERQRLVSIEADSHDPLTRKRVLEELGGEKLDFLFIDGDHSYEGVRSDFELYGDLVREGGILALHDINPDHGGNGSRPDSGEVPRFWEELKRSHPRTEELIAREGQNGYGIGLVFI